MKDIVKRLRELDESSLIMKVLRECLDAAEEIEALRQECLAKQKALDGIKYLIVQEQNENPKKTPKKSSPSKKKAK